MEFITFFEEGQPDISLYGGKGANLIKLYHMGIKIPRGFIINTRAFTSFLENSKHFQRIREIVSQELTPATILTISNEINDLILSSTLPSNISNEISSSLEKFHKSIGTKVLKAVRSSANIEDSENFSFAGQAESYLCKDTFEEIISSIKKCWASLFSPGALLYFLQIKKENSDLDLRDVHMAIIIQEMVDSDISGVSFTINVLNNEPNQILINSSWGLGEAIANNKTIPDTLIIDKKSFKIVNKILGKKEKMIKKDPSNSTTTTQDVPLELQGQWSLNKAQLEKIARICIKIEDKMGYPQDIEWAIEKDRFYILQSRPITTIK
jgi:pyruvate,water dikinase